MKRLIILIITTVLIAIIWSNAEVEKVQTEKYIPQKVLELSRPIDVTIDLEIINSLAPAYER